MKDIWNKDPLAWVRMTLSEKLEYLRKFHCTGPCGQSSAVLGNRQALDSALQEAVRIVRLLESHCPEH